MRRSVIPFILLTPLMCICLIGLYFLPPVHERLAWRAEEASLRVGYLLNPPAKSVFVPTEQGLTAPEVTRLSIQADPPPTSTIIPTLPDQTETAMPSATVTIFMTPTPTATPLPASVELKGVVYEDQHGRYNYCAPANLAMALSFWGWKGNRDVVGPILKPDEKDKNVMPYEMVSYIEQDTNLKVALRIGGDNDLLRRFVAAGFPVLVEKGTYLRDLTGVVSWMGHYQVVTGYNDGEGYFITQDSFIEPDHRVSYADMTSNWRAFNYTYLIIYPPEREPEVMALLGPDADEATNNLNAALKASNEIYGLSGIDQYFAWFNRGSSLVALQDYGGAAAAYDESFKIYPTIPESDRPWRMLWYQTGPYFAYYGLGRYYDLLYLADSTLNAMQGDKNLEESYYWRGMAQSALGNPDAAIQDFRTSLQYHQGFEPALYQLNLQGVRTP
jgi:Peptidase_C39 like family/Tetratricopeptide repeat